MFVVVLYGRAGVLMLKAMATSSDVAFFNVGYMLSQPLGFVSTALSMAAFPVWARRAQRGPDAVRQRVEAHHAERLPQELISTMLDCERAPSGRAVAIDRPSASGPSRHANGRPSGTSRVAPSRPRDSTGTGGSSGYRRHPRGTRVARGSAGRDRTERNPLDILPAPSASSGDQLHAAPDAEHRALAPGDCVLVVAALAACEVAVHDLATLRAVRHRRVGASMVHVVAGRR